MIPARKRFLFADPISTCLRIMGACLFLSATAPAAPKAASASQKAVLNQVRIHSLYNEGDFDRVVELIDSFTAANKSYSLDDSVFIAKHLAVVYTANPATREKGKGYMFRLLDLMPSAKIVDMFVSDEIDRIFERVKEEYLVRSKDRMAAKTSNAEMNQYALDKLIVERDSLAHKEPARSGGEPSPAKPKSKAKYWFAGGVAIVAIAGTASWYLMLPKKGQDTVYALR